LQTHLAPTRARGKEKDMPARIEFRTPICNLHVHVHVHFGSVRGNGNSPRHISRPSLLLIPRDGSIRGEKFSSYSFPSNSMFSLKIPRNTRAHARALSEFCSTVFGIARPRREVSFNPQLPSREEKRLNVRSCKSTNV
jgi:hypothetical protein